MPCFSHIRFHESARRDYTYKKTWKYFFQCLIDRHDRWLIIRLDCSTSTARRRLHSCRWWSNGMALWCYIVIPLTTSIGQNYLGWFRNEFSHGTQGSESTCRLWGVAWNTLCYTSDDFSFLLHKVLLFKYLLIICSSSLSKSRVVFQKKFKENPHTIQIKLPPIIFFLQGTGKKL